MQQLSAQEVASRSMTASYRRSPSPVRAQPYSTTAVVQLAEKIKNEEHFANAIPVSFLIFVCLKIALCDPSITVFAPTPLLCSSNKLLIKYLDPYPSYS